MELELPPYQSPHLEVQRLFSCKLERVLMIGAVPKVLPINILHVESRMLRPNTEPFTIEQPLLKTAVDILNRNPKETICGRFVADFACNSIKYIFKLVLLNPDKDSLQPLLHKVANDMKERLRQNLLSMLLTVGQVYHSFTDSPVFRKHLAMQEALQREIDSMKDQFNVQTSEMKEEQFEIRTENVLAVELPSVEGDEEKANSKPPKKEAEYKREGGYFRVEGRNAVLKTENGGHEEKIVIKTAKFPTDASTKSRIDNQLAIVRKLAHSGNVYLPKYIFSNALPQTIYMKWTTNYTLKDTVNYQPFSSMHRRVKFMLETCRALLSLHRQGIVHRDVKPSNFLLETDDTIKIIDFAESWDSSHPENFKRGSTMPYAAPEFFNEKLPVSDKSDCWSFGMLLYELLEGRPSAFYLKQLNAEYLKNLPKFSPLLLNRQNGSGVLFIHQKLRELVAKLLSYDPKGRPSLAYVERVLCRLSQYLDNLLKIEDSGTPQQ